MLNDNNSYNYKNRNLSEVFKELEQARNESIIQQQSAKKSKKKQQKKKKYCRKRL